MTITQINIIKNSANTRAEQDSLSLSEENQYIHLDTKINLEMKKWENKLEQLEKLEELYKDLMNKKIDLLHKEKIVSNQENLLKKLCDEIINFPQELNAAILPIKQLKRDLEQVCLFFKRLKTQEHKNKEQLKQFYQEIIYLIEESYSQK